MTTEIERTVIHTEVRCALDEKSTRKTSLGHLLEEMKTIEEEHGPLSWTLRRGIDCVTPCNRDGNLFYFEGTPIT